MAKFNVSMDDKLLAEVDRLANEQYTTRSGIISQGMVQLVNANKMASAVNNLSISLAKIAASNKLDEKTEEELKTIQIYFDMISKANK